MTPPGESLWNSVFSWRQWKSVRKRFQSFPKHDKGLSGRCFAAFFTAWRSVRNEISETTCSLSVDLTVPISIYYNIVLMSHSSQWLDYTVHCIGYICLEVSANICAELYSLTLFKGRLTKNLSVLFYLWLIVSTCPPAMAPPKNSPLSMFETFKI